MIKNRQNQGITLIALVITIILLLILATVAISLAVDSDGLFSKAGEAANKWNTSVAEEDAALQNLMTMLDEMDKLTLGKVYNEDMIGQSVTYSANGQEEWIILGEDPQKAGHILITTKAPIADAFELYGSAEKWLSYEEDLHAACSVYGGKIGDIEVESRSITMEDINAVTGFEKPEFETYTFGTVQDFANKKVNYPYPKAGSTWTDSNGKEYAGWKAPSIENEITFENDSYTYYDAIKGDIIFGTENNVYAYAVASRMVRLNSTSAYYRAVCVCAGIDGNDLCSSDEDAVHDTGVCGTWSIRPVVSLPPNIPMEILDIKK